jgi:omega-3 fatty acid desaturase (delta-15 desaturase)
MAEATTNWSQEEEIKKDEFPSLVEIKRAIPAKFFQPNLFVSISYVLFDFFLIATLFVSMFSIDAYLSTLSDSPLYLLKWIITPAYWFLQGTLFWSLFVLGHDCGHGSFSTNSTVNHFFGTILHSFILVPYHMWRLSHRHHHKNTANIQKDEIFYPFEKPNRAVITRSSYFGLGLAWFLYLACGFDVSYPRRVSHFNIYHPMFSKYFSQVSTSLASWIFMFSCVCYLTVQYGFSLVAFYYGAPLFVFASWLVIVTFLHHHESGVVWYNDSNWTYVKGNLNSIDRDYGILHWITHSIGTHQVHHLFPAIPHYYLVEATQHFRKAFPHLIKESKQSIWPSFVKNFHSYAEQDVIPEGSTHFVIR